MVLLSLHLLAVVKQEVSSRRGLVSCPCLVATEEELTDITDMSHGRE
jgi:hypothetical protein